MYQDYLTDQQNSKVRMFKSESYRNRFYPISNIKKWTFTRYIVKQKNAIYASEVRFCDTSESKEKGNSDCQTIKDK